jgi:hypothetical protein
MADEDDRADSTLPFTPETLGVFGRDMRELQQRLVCDVDPAASSGEAELYFRLAIKSLEESRIFLEIAAMKQSHALAVRGKPL